MPKYRKKPVVVNAYQMTIDTLKDYFNWPAWIQKGLSKYTYEEGAVFWGDGTLYIRTLEGTQVVSLDDYIIQGVKGEIYPCKPDIFEMTYEEVIE